MLQILSILLPCSEIKLVWTASAQPAALMREDEDSQSVTVARITAQCESTNDTRKQSIQAEI